MILNNFLSYNTKIYISIIFGSIWIYFRTDKCYLLLPRKKILSMLLVSVWIYLNYIEPLFLPIGLIIMYLYSIKT